MIEDIALMRAMPKMQVVVPADFNQAYRAVMDSYEDERLAGPMYMRFGRPATPAVYDEIPDTLGDGVDVLREGRDISIFACGHMVWRALEAAETLKREDGIEAEVVNVAVIKPLADDAVLSHSRRRASRSPPRSTGSSADSPTQSARSPPRSTRSRSSPTEWATSSASPAPARPVWSTSASPPRASPTRPGRRC